MMHSIAQALSKYINLITQRHAELGSASIYASIRPFIIHKRP